jgi:uncharacterized protein GlcG (DUF336 family)
MINAWLDERCAVMFDRCISCAALVLMLSFAATAAAEPKLLVAQTTLSTDAALQAARAALESCSSKGYTVAVAVVDRSGTPLALLRDNLAGGHTPSTATGKAATAVSFRFDTSELVASTQPGSASAGIRQLPNVVPIAGGVVIRAKGSLVGGIGVSGAPGGDADEVCARAGIAAISDALELE